MKLMYSILISCLLLVGQVHAAALDLLDATRFDPQPIFVQAKNNSVPVGTVIAWTQEAIPEGWLECNGEPVNRMLYPDLHALMPNTPDYRGMFLRGAGSQTLEHGRYGSVTHGTALGKIQGDTIRNITGDFTPVDGGALGAHGAFYTEPSQRHHIYGVAPLWNSEIYKFNINRVVPTAEENRPVNIGVKFIIKAE